MRRLALLLLCALASATTVAVAQSAGSDLPDIGNPAGELITGNDEYQLGAMIVRQMRDQNQLVDDPEVTEYVQTVGQRLSAQAQEGGQRFKFFVVKDSSINAFALPGGFIGVNYGLVLATKNESELASVLAHEIAHVTQRHIARTINAQSRQSLANAAAILAAILVGAAVGGDGVQGAIAASQGLAAQQQINFTRANEYEADRVGISFLAAAGFDPQAMPAFFETMGRRSGLAGMYVPEMIQSHPVTTNRIAESRSRASQYETPRNMESSSYLLVRERLKHITVRDDIEARNVVVNDDEDPAAKTDLGKRYGEALSLMTAGKNQQAAKILSALIQKYQGLTMLWSALGQAEVAGGLQNDGLSTFAHALQIFPRNVPLSVRYAEALIAAGRGKEAHTLLLDLFNNVPPTPSEIRLTALAANNAGDTGDSYYYMGEYHIASGDLQLAVQQLDLALNAPNLTDVQRQRYRARRDEIREYLSTVNLRRVSNSR